MEARPLGILSFVECLTCITSSAACVLLHMSIPGQDACTLVNFTSSLLQQYPNLSILEHDPLVANDDVTTKFEEVATSSPPPTFLPTAYLPRVRLNHEKKIYITSLMPSATLPTRRENA
jgi:hypothetical protein